MNALFKVFRLKNPNWRYQHLVQKGHDDEFENGRDNSTVAQRKPERRCVIPLIAFTIIILAALALVYTVVSTRQITSSSCLHPVQRREWRTLQPSEQQEYIDAVLCLSTKSSIFKRGTSRYDDFAYAHVFEGTAPAHHAAAFLPWHRYFIHVFESLLRDECGFPGNLPYWDWALDAEDLAKSPVWAIEGGFGGNGDLSSLEPEVFGGKCVMDGPFTNITRHWQSKSNGHGFEVISKPHCLSRGFAQTVDDKDAFKARISPAAIKGLLDQPRYPEMLDILEIKIHNTIPHFVRGDFSGLTAPNDPVWFLHHGQIDRLWWLWQQRDLSNRQREYLGSSGNTWVYKNMTHSGVSVTDSLSIGPLAASVQVNDLMSTQSGLLCYRY